MLTPYQGNWTNKESAHLLRRTLFGATIEQITNATTNGLTQTITDLLSTYNVSPPLSYSEDDTSVNIGETWIGVPLPTIDRQPAKQTRYNSLRAWLIERVTQHNTLSIVEKLSFFWQNHFACDFLSSDPQGSYEYLMLLRNNCLGNFKQLVKGLTIHPLMLRFLNGHSSSKDHPNENFARELFELYTIGKGPQIASGDYTNYTEHDILEGAKILTGWRYRNHSSTTLPQISSYFTASRHDNTDKTLSEKFGNAIITGNGETEYADFIDLIFQQNEVARFICKKLYQWFVKADVDTAIVDAMAQTMITNNYDVTPVLRELFLSEHFFDIANRGTIVKNPIELMASMLKSTNSTLSNLNYSEQDNYRIMLVVRYHIKLAGMEYFRPPNVAGWTAYYLEPSFSDLWINSALLLQRFNTTKSAIIYSGFSNHPVNDVRYKVDFLNFLEQLEQVSNPSNAETVIDLLETLFVCKPLAVNQRNALKSTLTDGLPDFEWTAEYTDYLANPDDTTFSDPVAERIKLVLAQLFQMPEFQIQ